jgi:hypothetical protein
MKERISFVELAFRLREEEVASLNRELTKTIKAAMDQAALQQMRGLRVRGSLVDKIRADNDSVNATFKASVDEFNE